MIVGAFPEALGVFDIPSEEMMFWLYCPIATPDSKIVFPSNLRQFEELVNVAVQRDLERAMTGYIYLTAKRLYVSGDNVGQRPGWHTDGFGSDDINFIWCDRCPTVFAFGSVEVSDDHAQSILDMENAAPNMHQRVYPAKTLLRLTPDVMHRAPDGVLSGMRTFVKISFSRERYNLSGNSINYELSFDGAMYQRSAGRNHPVSGG